MTWACFLNIKREDSFSDSLPSCGSSRRGLVLPERGPGFLGLGLRAKAGGVGFRGLEQGHPRISIVCSGTRVEAHVLDSFRSGVDLGEGEPGSHIHTSSPLSWQRSGLLEEGGGSWTRAVGVCR